MNNTQKIRKGRAHRALFDDDLPFKPKVVASKLFYKRRAKHRSRDIEG